MIPNDSQMTYSLNSQKGVIYKESIIGRIQVDTWSLDYSSNGVHAAPICGNVWLLESVEGACGLIKNQRLLPVHEPLA